MVHGHVEKASRELSAASQGHGVFLCRGCHFALIAMVRKSNLAGQQQQRTELPRVLMNNDEQWRTLCRSGDGVARQLAGFRSERMRMTRG